MIQQIEYLISKSVESVNIVSDWCDVLHFADMQSDKLSISELNQLVELSELYRNRWNEYVSYEKPFIDSKDVSPNIHKILEQKLKNNNT